MGNERRIEKLRYLHENKIIEKKQKNEELRNLANLVMMLAIKYNRKDIVNAMKKLINTINQTGILSAEESQKTQWVLNFQKQLQNQKKR